MNKNIKRIIAITLAVTAISTISSVRLNTYFIGTKPVYASSYSADDGELKSLKIKSLDGETVDLREGYNGSTVKLSDDREYYGKLTDDSDGLKISASVEGDGYIVKIFTSAADNATAYNPGDEILLGKGDTTLYIRTYESKSAFNKVKNDVSTCEEEYTLNVRKTTESSFEDADQDSIYIDSMELSRGDLDFIKQKTTYDTDVDEDVKSIWIKAIPEDDDDRVRVNGSLVDSDDNYKKVVSLDKGENEIKVKITDDKDNQRTYTINITRGEDSDTEDDVYIDDLTLSKGEIDFSEDETSYDVDLDESISKITIGVTPEDDDYLVTIDGDEVNSDDDYEKDISLDKGENIIKVTVEDELNDKKRTYTLTINRGEVQEDDDIDTNTETETDNSDKKSQWVQTEEGWKYYDENGAVLKNSWLFDKEKQIYCYLNENGLRVTGWFNNNGKWYLMDSKGAMLTGWQYTDGKWYMLNQTSGEMRTGWYTEETTTTGSSAGTDSNSKKSGNWYYLNQDGSMKTGWLLDNDKWYFFNSNGTMQRGWLIDFNSKYYLTEDGTMATGTNTISGKVYKFTSNGVLII